jgi:hypothetical protein
MRGCALNVLCRGYGVRSAWIYRMNEESLTPKSTSTATVIMGAMAGEEGTRLDMRGVRLRQLRLTLRVQGLSVGAPGAHTARRLHQVAAAKQPRPRVAGPPLPAQVTTKSNRAFSSFRRASSALPAFSHLWRGLCCSRVLPSRRGRSLRPGEWQCGQCGFDNFASRVECFKCGADK